MSEHHLLNAQAFLMEQMPRLRGYLRMMTGHREDAEDILQETCLKYLRSGPQPGTPQARSWLFAVCRNRAVNLTRDRARRRRREEQYAESFSGEESDGSTARERADNLGRIESCMRKMPVSLREMLYLNVVTGLSVREIGERLGVSKSTAATRVREALIELNRCYHGELPT